MFSRDRAVKYAATFGREGNAGKVIGGRLMRLTKLFVLLALAGGGAAEAATLNASLVQPERRKLGRHFGGGW